MILFNLPKTRFLLYLISNDCIKIKESRKKNVLDYNLSPVLCSYIGVNYCRKQVKDKYFLEQ